MKQKDDKNDAVGPMRMRENVRGSMEHAHSEPRFVLSETCIKTEVRCINDH